MPFDDEAVEIEAVLLENALGLYPALLTFFPGAVTSLRWGLVTCDGYETR